LAHGPLNTYSYTGCIVNVVRFLVHSLDVRSTTQNSGVVTVGEDDTTYYGQLEGIIELNYINGYSVVLFRCKWFDTRGKRIIMEKNNILIDVSREWYVGKEWYDDIHLILATQAKQVFYLQDPSRVNNWRVVENVHHRKLWDYPNTSAVSDIDVLHDTLSLNYNLDVDSGREVGESCEVGGDTQLSARDTQSFSGQLVVDLGNIPMRTTLDEDESFIDDDEEDQGACHSDEEDELNDDDEEDDNPVDTFYYSDDSD
jgi:hypothetical protein